MRGWRMETSTPPVAHHSLLPLIAITVPLIGSWLLLIWYMYRNQQVRLQESTFRSEMTAKLSHDLRTPIANLRLYTDLLLRRSGDEAAVNRYGAVMRAEVERLALLADNTIVYGRTAAPAPVRLEEAVPDAVVDATIARYENLIAARGSTVEVVHDAARAPASSIASASSAFSSTSSTMPTNMRRGASSSPPAKRRVRSLSACAISAVVSIRRHKPSCWLWVQPGGSAKDGFGLGLVVVRELAEANGGRVTIENADPGLRVTASMKIKGAAKEEAKCPS